jgi:hypothetical protein
MSGGGGTIVIVMGLNGTGGNMSIGGARSVVACPLVIAACLRSSCTLGPNAAIIEYACGAGTAIPNPPTPLACAAAAAVVSAVVSVSAAARSRAIAGAGIASPRLVRPRINDDRHAPRPIRDIEKNQSFACSRDTRRFVSHPFRARSP